MYTTVILSLYRGEKYLSEYLRHLEGMSLFPNFEFMVRAVLPSKGEMEILESFQRYTQLPMGLTWTSRHEPLGRTWNELIDRSSGKFVAIWNVDDIRFPASLMDQEQLLLDDPKSAVACGPFWVVGPGKKRQLFEDTAPTQFDLRTGFHLGPFPMFRKSALVNIGGFDEQFVSACDYDLALRLAERETVSWSSNVLGEFRNSHSGLSTATCVGLIERTAIELRYGLEGKVNPVFRGRARSYCLDQMTVRGLKGSLGAVFGEIESVRHRNRRLDLKSKGRLRELLIAMRCVIRSWTRTFQRS